MDRITVTCGNFTDQKKDPVRSERAKTRRVSLPQAAIGVKERERDERLERSRPCNGSGVQSQSRDVAGADDPGQQRP